jgi:anti-anti-sigma factor
VLTHVEGGTVALGLSSHSDAGTVTILVDGDVDLSNAAEFEQQATAHIEAGATTILVDLTAVPFIDSAGIHALVHARRTAKEQGRTLRVMRASDMVREVLEITGVWSHLTHSDT